MRATPSADEHIHTLPAAFASRKLQKAPKPKLRPWSALEARTRVTLQLPQHIRAPRAITRPNE